MALSPLRKILKEGRMAEQEVKTKRVWVVGKNLLNGGEQPRPEVKNVLDLLGIQVIGAVPASKNVHHKDMVQLSGPIDVMSVIISLVDAKRA
jgi:hypothetical protein